MASDDDTGGVKEKVEEVVGNGSKSKEILASAAVSAIGALAAAKGPDLVRKVVGATEEKGEEEAEEMGEKAVDGAKERLSNAGPGGKIAAKLMGGGGGSGGKKTRRLPIQRWTDVALPIDQVYEEFTKFDQFPAFMHRVLNVEQKGKDKISWSEKIWFSSRQWEGRVTERRENDRIVWKTTSGMSHYGIVSFHRLSDNLTRVMVDMEFEPNGIMEKMASGLRFVKRAVQADLARYKAYVEMEDAKGIEYRAVRDDDDDKQEKQGKQDNGSNGSGGSDDGKDDAERENERRERESRRDERRKETAG